MPGVTLIDPFKDDEDMLTGHVVIDVHGVQLPFLVEIKACYPFHFHGSDSISFINKDLISYDHVMENGGICIHTLHCPVMEQKLQLDIDGLKQWIGDYYVGHVTSAHYEHIVVQYGQFNETEFHYLFTDVDYTFNKCDFGFIDLAFLAQGRHSEKAINTFLISEFKAKGKNAKCKWSEYYQVSKTGIGLYIYIETPPVTNKRFIVKNWIELEAYVNPAFMRFLYEASKKINKEISLPIPLLIGYKIPGDEIHWQCAAINAADFPIYGEKVPGTKNYTSRFCDEEITWLQTKNCSYRYFFGRGTLAKKITNGKTLIIGIGAIGSTLASTLVRGGCTDITLADYDIKEPENVCRAEYSFVTGVNGKVDDLGKALYDISPFLWIRTFEGFTDYIKHYINGGQQNKDFQEILDQFDLIIDCSADNDMAFILDSLELKTRVINLSVTNRARELVCVTNPNLYKWLTEIYALFQQDDQDLYNPTGCWNPTFKATHNDIAVMVHHAVKQINHSFETNKPPGNFYLRAEAAENINITLHKF